MIDKTLPDDGNLDYSECKMVRADHLSKCGGVCVYYKELLSLIIINVNNLKECLRSKFKKDDKLCSFISLYRFPSERRIKAHSKRSQINLNKIWI